MANHKSLLVQVSTMIPFSTTSDQWVAEIVPLFYVSILRDCFAVSLGYHGSFAISMK